MFCSKCGHKNIDGAVFCEKCGQRIEDESLKENTWQKQAGNPNYNSNHNQSYSNQNYNNPSYNDQNYDQGQNFNSSSGNYARESILDRINKKYLMIGLACVLSISVIGYYFYNSSNTKNIIEYREASAEDNLRKKEDKEERLEHKTIDESLAFYDGIKNGNKKKWEKSVSLQSDKKIQDVAFSSLEKGGTYLERYRIPSYEDMDSEEVEELKNMGFLVNEGVGTLKGTEENFKWVSYTLGDKEISDYYGMVPNYEFFLVDDDGNDIPITEESRLLILGNDLKEITFEYIDNQEAFYDGTYTDDDVEIISLDLDQYLLDPSEETYLDYIRYDTQGQDVYVVPFLCTSVIFPLILNSVVITSDTGEERRIEGDGDYGAYLYEMCNFYDFNSGLLNEEGNLATIINENIYNIINGEVDYSYSYAINALLGERYFQSILLGEVGFLAAVTDDYSSEEMEGLGYEYTSLEKMASLEQIGWGVKVSPEDLFK